MIGGWPIEADFTNSTLLGYYKHIGSAMATSNRVWSANNYLVQSNGTTVAFTTNYLGGGSYP